jgi:hypothetical protein
LNLLLYHKLQSENMRFFAFLLAFVVPACAFFSGKVFAPRGTFAVSMSTTEVKAMKTIDAPDFYWKYRLERLISKKGGDFGFKASNYAHLSQPKDLYDAYYLDLVLAGKLEGFNWKQEKVVSDEEWVQIYKQIAQWSATTVSANRPTAASLPSNDFDLLKEFYPSLDYRELESSFTEDEVGPNFPYSNMKELLSAASKGKLNIPGFEPTTTLEATEVKASLSALKEKTLAKLDVILEDALAYAKNPYPDEQSKVHYQKLRAKLADFPQTANAWSVFRANMEKEIDEMATLASKPEDPHHGHHEEGEEGHDDHHHEEKLSVAQEFEAKYGLNLDELERRMEKFKSNPQAFLEDSIIEKYGKNGLDVWKKSQEFSAKMAVMSEADKAATEKAFADFVSKA